MAITTVVVPFVLMLLILRFKPGLATARRFSFLLLFAVAYGICIRFLIAPITGHPQDLNYWTTPIRMFYGSGVVDIRLYPMPFTYYPVLFSYSPYALMQVLGFQDTTFFAHSVGVVESIFVKAPFIFSDIFSLFFIYKILGKFDPAESARPKRLGYALLFFLGPVLILSSSGWPLVDGVATALLLAGIYYGLLEEKPMVGALFFTLSGVTKVFGFLGFVPLAFLLIKQRKISKLLIAVALAAAVSFMVYLPLFDFSSGLIGLPEFFLQFLRGRAGFGSGGFLASDSYFSYLSLVGFSFNTEFLTYLLAALFGAVSVYFILQLRKLDLSTQKMQMVQMSLLYFAVFFFLFYLIFYRVYEYYYLLILPFLIMYAYSRKLNGPLFSAVILSMVAAPILLLSCLVYGAEYYWIALNLPADPSIISVVFSTLVAVAFLTVVPLKGRLGVLRTGRGFLALAGFATWFVFGFAYYAYYKVLFLGWFWFVVSFAVALGAFVFFTRNYWLRRLRANSNVGRSDRGSVG